MTARRQLLAGLALLVALVPSLLAQEQRSARASFDAATWIPANAPFEIALTGADRAGIAVTLGKTDISALFERPSPGVLRYHGRGPALPSGEGTIRVYDVDEKGAWQPIGQFPIRILTPMGFISTKVQPTADVTGKGQFGGDHTPETSAPPRGSFQDATTQLGLRTELVRPAFTLTGQTQLTGVTYRNEALRFSAEGDRAPRLDLAGYRLDLKRGTSVLSVGHFSVGGLRHLINGFQSRGVSLTIGEGRPWSLQLATMNGSNIAGWSNSLGIANSRHRFSSATVGMEVFRKKPGLLRVELGHFRGSQEPRSGFNQSAVVVAETSRGNALRVATAHPGGRWRFDGGYTVSRFDDEFDAEVEGNLAVTPLDASTRDALYGDLSLALVQNRKVRSSLLNLGLNLRHQDVEPLFRSLGVFVQPDLRTTSGDMTIGLGPLNAVVGHMRTRNNLAGITSILTSRTERSSLNVNLPTGSLFMRKGVQPRWAPMVTIQAERLHQFADQLPVAGDFNVQSLPDQYGTNVMLGAEWQIAAFRVGTRLSRSKQDNRQPGSEDADFVTDTTALTFGWSPKPTFSFSGDVGLDANRSVAGRKTSNTMRWGTNTSWTFYKQMAMAASITNNRAWDSLDVRDSENLDGYLELSSGFRLSRADRRKGRIFVRWVNQRADLIDRSFGFNDSRRNSSFSTGLSLSVLQ